MYIQREGVHQSKPASWTRWKQWRLRSKMIDKLSPTESPVKPSWSACGHKEDACLGYWVLVQTSMVVTLWRQPILTSLCQEECPRGQVCRRRALTRPNSASSLRTAVSKYPSLRRINFSGVSSIAALEYGWNLPVRILSLKTGIRS